MSESLLSDRLRGVQCLLGTGDFLGEELTVRASDECTQFAIVIVLQPLLYITQVCKNSLRRLRHLLGEILLVVSLALLDLGGQSIEIGCVLLDGCLELLNNLRTGDLIDAII